MLRLKSRGLLRGRCPASPHRWHTGRGASVASRFPQVDSQTGALGCATGSPRLESPLPPRQGRLLPRPLLPLGGFLSLSSHGWSPCPRVSAVPASSQKAVSHAGSQPVRGLPWPDYPLKPRLLATLQEWGTHLPPAGAGPQGLECENSTPPSPGPAPRSPLPGRGWGTEQELNEERSRERSPRPPGVLPPVPRGTSHLLPGLPSSHVPT